MRHKDKKVTVEIDASTARWLKAFAKANNLTAGEMLRQAAYCLADHAGRRTGSWEASVAGSLAVSSGWSSGIPWSALERLYTNDEAENRAFRERLPKPEK